jgi:hypothetical protein
MGCRPSGAMCCVPSAHVPVQAALCVPMCPGPHWDIGSWKRRTEAWRQKGFSQRATHPPPQCIRSATYPLGACMASAQLFPLYMQTSLWGKESSCLTRLAATSSSNCHLWHISRPASQPATWLHDGWEVDPSLTMRGVNPSSVQSALSSMLTQSTDRQIGVPASTLD